MKKYFITYGDEKYAASKARIVGQANELNIFDKVFACGSEDVTDEVRVSVLMSIPRGAGLWVWKPDVILSALQEMEYGDILIYADAGCLLCKSKEWEWLENKLQTYDMIVQRIYHRTYKWTRREIIDLFPDNPRDWTFKYQHCATTMALKKTPFTMRFVEEWRRLMLDHPEAVMDVTSEELPNQPHGFIENRHDQAMFSALVYRYLDSGHILAIWDHIRGRDPFRIQAIRAARLRHGESTDGVSPLMSLLKGLNFKFKTILIKRPTYHICNILHRLRRCL